MNYFIILTTECDLKCRYCYGKAIDFSWNKTRLRFDYSLPETISYTIQDLASFISKDPDATLILYGGEPTLRPELIKQILQKVKAKRFMIQTHGLHLDRLSASLLKQFHTILVSIDGDRVTTDYYRGHGVYDRIIRNTMSIRDSFQGEIVARMTVAENTDIFRQVTHLAGLGLFDSVHWQLDALFGTDFQKRDFQAWVHKSYNPGIEKLLEWWIKEIKNGKVHKIYPFQGLVQSYMKGEKTMLRCGAGWIQFAILTDGTIAPCPVMAGLKDFYLGNIKNTTPKDIERVCVSGQCRACRLLNECGGRCLYANRTMWWGQEGFSQVCGTVENILDCIKKVLPEIKKLLKENKISMRDFEYTKYNSCEIIP